MPIATFTASYTSTIGDQDFTLPGFGTPEVVLVERVRGPDLTNNTTAMYTSYGFIHNIGGIQQFAAGLRVDDGNNPAPGACGQASGSCIRIRANNNGSDVVRAQCTAFITDGVTLNFSAADDSTISLLRFTFMRDMVEEADIQAKNRTNASVVTGFQPDLILSVGSYNGEFGSSASSPLHIRGVAQRFPAGQRAFYAQSFLFGDMIFAAGSDGNEIASEVNETNTMRVSAWNADGYTISVVGSDTGSYVGILALKFKEGVEYDMDHGSQGGDLTNIVNSTVFEPTFELALETFQDGNPATSGAFASGYNDGVDTRWHSFQGEQNTTTDVQEKTSVQGRYAPNGANNNNVSWTWNPTNSTRVVDAASASFQREWASLVFGNTSSGPGNIKLGGTDIEAIKLGSNDVTKVYLGSTEL